MTKSICFDVLGTCFGFDAVIAIIDRQLGLKFKAVQVDSKSFFFSWFYAAQRDFTYNSMVDNYVPIAQILMKTFRRACLIVDLPASDVKDEDISAVMESIKALTARPGLKLCYDSLREDGWDVYGVTNGAEETSLNYYRRADIDLGSDHMLSCDELKKAKPDYNVYQKATEVVAAAGCTGQQRWFVAAHSWVSRAHSLLSRRLNSHRI